ncbi:MAG: hypothetical protein GTO14_21995 [Anaerolineales bacterium]|nr:hypothetical protein [Anaerolineales bacterium]
MSNYKIIVKPVSKRGTGARSVPQLKGELSRDAFDFNLVYTERPWHAVELSKQAVPNGFDTVVSVGGDGTANEVLSGLMQAKRESFEPAVMGLISVGRGNDVAFGMNVPGGVEAGCQILQ